MANRIQLKGGFRLEEAVAAGTITPGHLLEVNSDGKVIVHNSEGAYAERLFAVEDALQGNEIDDDYSAADLVQYHVVDPGAEVYAYIQAGQDIDIGDLLISGGDGTLIENGQELSTTTVQQIIAVAMEAVDLTASGAVDTRIAVRVL